MSLSAQSLAQGEFHSLFTGECAVPGCDRRPAKSSRFCASCKEDRRENRKVVFRAAQEMLPAMRFFERNDGRCLPGGLSKSESHGETRPTRSATYRMVRGSARRRAS